MSRQRRLLVVFVDALGPEQIDLLGPYVSDLHERRSLSGVLGYSSAALPTILTGQPPHVHGRMCTFRHAEGRSALGPLRWLGLLPRVVHERATVRKAAASAVRRLRGWDGYLDLYRVPPEAFGWVDVAEREDMFNAETVGGASTFLARARAAGITVDVTPWQTPERRRLDAALERARTRPAQLTFAYATALDGTMHAKGASSAEAVLAGAEIGRSIDALRTELARGADLSVIVAGDHGMRDVARVVDPRPLLRHLSLRSFVDSTFLRLWGKDHELEAVRKRLDESGVPARFLGRDDLTRRGAPTEGSPYGDAVVVADEGTVFSPSFVGGVPRAMHGYDIDAPSARAALLSDRPLPERCFALEHVAGAVEHALGTGAQGGPS